MYRARVGAPGPYFSSPVAANGRVIVASGDGVVSVLGTGDHLEVLATNDLGDRILPRRPSWAVVLRPTASTLFAFAQK